MTEQHVSKQTLARLPTYLNYLKSISPGGAMYVSATTLADALELGEVQVRKDLAAISSGGKPKVGYVAKDLIKDLQVYLGYDNVNKAVLVGAGKLGKALLSYKGFDDYGLNIVAAFDVVDSIVGTEDGEKPILPITDLTQFCKKTKIKIGIITVPTKHAQEICNMLVDSGVLAIWNFAPIHLAVPDNILVKNENMAASLAILSKHLIDRLND
jgi:redox-sensing transcriptional repressor